MGTGVAVRRSARLTAACIVLAMVAGCGNDKSEPSPMAATMGAVAKAALSNLPGRKAKAAAAAGAPAPVTRADIEKYGIPILRVVIPARGADALVTITDTKGDVVTWSTTDGTTFTLRDGVLIQTRGLGPDLMSSSVPSVADLLTPGGTHPRQYFFLGDNDQTTRRSYDCTVTIVGSETIEIFGRAHRVTRVSEECARAQGKITNDFWIEGRTIRKSRQLASGGAGFIEFERVVD